MLSGFLCIFVYEIVDFHYTLLSYSLIFVSLPVPACQSENPVIYLKYPTIHIYLMLPDPPVLQVHTIYPVLSQGKIHQYHTSDPALPQFPESPGQPDPDIAPTFQQREIRKTDCHDLNLTNSLGYHPQNRRPATSARQRHALLIFNGPPCEI